jgi:hypothetical protein
VIAAIAITGGCGTASRSSEPRDGGGDTSTADVGPNIEELPPIDVATPTMRIVDLSSSEQISLCDWTARELGGYGGIVSCPEDAADTMLAAPISLQDCVSVLQIGKWGPDCPLTVQDFMSCTNWQVDNVCNICQAGACSNGTYNLPLPPECVTLGGPQCEGAINSDAGLFNATDAGGSDATGADAAGTDAAPSADGTDASSSTDATASADAGADTASASDAGIGGADSSPD